MTTGIGACSTFTFFQLFEEHNQKFREVALRQEIPLCGTMYLHNTHTIKCKGKENVRLPLLEEEESVKEFIEAPYDADLYDLEHAHLQALNLVEIEKKSSGTIRVTSNAAEYLYAIQAKNFLPDTRIPNIGNTFDSILEIPAAPAESKIEKSASLVPAHRPLNPKQCTHQFLLRMFGRDLLDNGSLKIQYKDHPHRVISRYHIVAGAIATKETLDIPVYALGEEIERAEIFVIPEEIYKRLADMIFQIFSEPMELMDATKVQLEVQCEEATEMEISLHWIFQLSLKRLPDTLKFEDIVLNINDEPTLVLTLMTLTDQREYKFQKKSTYEKVQPEGN